MAADWPIVARFEHFKQKEHVKSCGRELRETDFSMNDHFSKEILERRKIFFTDLEKVHESRLPCWDG